MVTPFEALLPRGHNDPVAGIEMRLGSRRTPGLLQYVVVDPRDLRPTGKPRRSATADVRRDQDPLLHLLDSFKRSSLAPGTYVGFRSSLGRSGLRRLSLPALRSARLGIDKQDLRHKVMSPTDRPCRCPGFIASTTFLPRPPFLEGRPGSCVVQFAFWTVWSNSASDSGQREILDAEASLVEHPQDVLLDPVAGSLPFTALLRDGLEVVDQGTP